MSQVTDRPVKNIASAVTRRSIGLFRPPPPVEMAVPDEMTRSETAMLIKCLRPSWSCNQCHVNRFSFHLVEIGTIVSKKIQLNFLYVDDIGPTSRNDLDLQYSHFFIHSIRCLLLLTFRSLAENVSEKNPHCFHFFPI